MSASSTRRFPLVQALRAVAASSVALTHILHDALSIAPGSGTARALYGAMPWEAGVDIFFVISGFVIVHASAALFAAPGGAGRFLAHRLARIVPLYWIMTSLFLAESVFAPGAINGAVGGAASVVCSYLFIPHARPDGLVQPVFGLGWTLNYEMFFYAVFTPFLIFRRLPAVAMAVTLLAGFVLAGQAGWLHGLVLQSWANPIVLEFCAGMSMALLAGWVVLPAVPRLALVIAALVWLHVDPGWPRLFAYGVPAAFLVFAAITGKAETRLPTLERWLVLLGDASYALYLTHPFVMRAASILWQHLHRPGGVWAYVAFSVITAQLAALAIHRTLERPMTRALRHQLS